MTKTKKEPTLLELIRQAAEDVETYREPDLGDLPQRLGTITEAMGKGNVARDFIDSIHVGDSEVIIRTSWSTRGCVNNSSYEIPVSILNASDPVHAATVWKVDKNIAEAEREILDADKRAAFQRERLIKLRQERETLELFVQKQT